MQIGEFNANISRTLATVVASGAPEPVTRHSRDYVTVAPTELFAELVQAAGPRGQAILQRYRDTAEQEQETAA